VPAAAPLSESGALTNRAPRTVLLIEDEESIGNLVRTYFARDQFNVVWLRSGEEALLELASQKIDLVVLDIGLPGIDGFEVCRRIRSRSQVPILMLTARDEEPDRITGFELGADDYVLKPFSPRELVARAHAILRRGRQAAYQDVLRLGEVEVRRSERVARADDQEVKLTNKEFDLLTVLIENAGLVLTREKLLDEVWGMTYPGDTRTVDVHIAQLRRKLGLQDLIVTVRGVGYKAIRE
jgi:Response regulators consisting of a CheY-like receiver domain and a winged-helix DNA-binding domain